MKSLALFSSKKVGCSLFMLLVLAACSFEESRPKPTNTVNEYSEKQPEFPGGEKALYEYISYHVDYPAEARDEEISGQVMIQFIVSKSGKVKDVRVRKGVHPLLNKEAVRVITEMPEWYPGELKGKPVDVTYNIPINFILK